MPSKEQKRPVPLHLKASYSQLLKMRIKPSQRLSEGRGNWEVCVWGSREPKRQKKKAKKITSGFSFAVPHVVKYYGV